MKTDAIKRRVDELLSQAQAALSTQYMTEPNSFFGSASYVENGLYVEWRSVSLSFLVKVFGSDHIFPSEFEGKVNHRDAFSSSVKDGISILKAAKQEIDGGWLAEFRGLVSAEIFADFLEMAVHLLEQDYKDPAAVMTGSVLEEHLRQLCQSNGIPTDTVKDGKSIPKKADTMNAELTKAGVYNALSQKSVTAWLDLRNKAAHGKYSEYTIEEVRLMQQGVTDFIARTT